MVGFLSKIFGSKKGEENSIQSKAQEIVEQTLHGLLKRARLVVQFEAETAAVGEEKVIKVRVFGEDEGLFKDRDGELIDSVQLLLKWVVQHQLPDEKWDVEVDCAGFKEERFEALIERAESLKNMALEQNKSVYYRALPPKERKVVHQYLAKDPRVKSRSLGEGLYKKIKIFPSNENSR